MNGLTFPRFMLALVMVALTGCATTSSTRLTRFEYAEPQMGIPFQIILFATDKSIADGAVDAAYKRVAELNHILSDYETDSELNILCRTSGSGQFVHVSRDLWKVLQEAQTLSESSGGAFDVSIGPCVGLWRKARREKVMPDPARLADALARVGYTNIVLEPKTRRVKLMIPRMQLDLGAIAKGYAIDEALRVVREHGISRAMVTGNGDMALGEAPPGRAGWRIELSALEDDSGKPVKRWLILKNCAVGTSGDRFQKLEIEGRRYSHILDPKTGIGMTDHSLVTVVGPDCMHADPLATTVSVLGPKKGMNLVSKIKGMQARMVRRPGEHAEETLSFGFSRLKSEN